MAARVSFVKRFLPVVLLILCTVLIACDGDGATTRTGQQQTGKATSLQDGFTKPVVRIPLAGGNRHHLFGIKDCHIYKALQTGNVTGEWSLLFKPEPYLLPKACVRERLEMQGQYLQIEIGTQAIGAGGCCTTYAAYRTLDGETWEIRPATSIKTWQPLEQPKDKTESSAGQVVQFAEKFVGRLAQRKSVADLLRPTIDFVYHADNRCDGNTDGEVRNIPALQFEAAFDVRVTNDGDAWGCEKKAPSTRTIVFDLKKSLSTWDRFEVAWEAGDSSAFHVQGRGASDYLVVHLQAGDGRPLVVGRIEYRSEDPG